MSRTLMLALVVWGIVGAAARAESKTEVKVYVLKYANAEHVAKLLANLVRPNLGDSAKSDDASSGVTKIAADAKSSRIVVVGSDLAKSRYVIESVITALDVPVPGPAASEPSPMVQIEVLIIETVNSEKAKSANEAKKSEIISGEQLKEQLGLAKSGAVALAKDVAARIDRLESRGRLRVLRRSVVSVTSGETGQLTIGSNEPYVAGSSFSQYGQQNSVSYRDVGHVLTVSPRVDPDGRITAKIVVNDSRFLSDEDGVIITQNKDKTLLAPRILSISAQSNVRLADGQATAIGGLATNGDQQDNCLILVTARLMTK